MGNAKPEKNLQKLCVAALQATLTEVAGTELGNGWDKNNLG